METTNRKKKTVIAIYPRVNDRVVLFRDPFEGRHYWISADSSTQELRREYTDGSSGPTSVSWNDAFRLVALGQWASRIKVLNEDRPVKLEPVSEREASGYLLNPEWVRSHVGDPDQQARDQALRDAATALSSLHQWRTQVARKIDQLEAELATNRCVQANRVTAWKAEKDRADDLGRKIEEVERARAKDLTEFHRQLFHKDAEIARLRQIEKRHDALNLNHPATLVVFQDGTNWCCVQAREFRNIQDSHAEFGLSPLSAVRKFMRRLRGWFATHLSEEQQTSLHREISGFR